MNVTLQKVAINTAMLLEAGHSYTAVPLIVNFIVICFYLSATRSHSRAQNCIKFGKFFKDKLSLFLTVTVHRKAEPKIASQSQTL